MNRIFGKSDKTQLPSKWTINALDRILITWLIAIASFVAIVFIVGVPTLTTWLSLGVGTAVTLACLRLNRRGYTQLAVTIICTTYWITVAFGVATGGGLHTSSWAIFMPLIMMMGLFINARISLMITIMTAFFITFLAWGMEEKIILPLPYDLNIYQIYAMSITPFFLLSTLVYFTSKAMQEAFTTAQLQKNVADGRLAQLEQLNNNLTESEMRFRSIVESSADAILITDSTGQIQLANLQLATWLGYTRQELSITNIGDIDIMPNPPSYTMIRREASEGDPFTLRTTYRRKNGSTFPVDVRIVAIELNGEVHLMGAVRDITEQEVSRQQLEASLTEKELLLKEINHRVKNNLQILSSILRMSLREKETHFTANDVLKLQGRVRSMSRIHTQLYQTNDFAHIEFSHYIRMLVQDISQAFSVDSSVIFDLRLQPITLAMNVAIPAGLIINELITNAIKHGHPHVQHTAQTNGKVGTVVCELTADKNEVTIMVANDGMAFDAEQIMQEKKTMGIQLITILTRQLNGKLVVKSDETQSCFMITFDIEQ